jgi:hypothetical protein
VLALGIRRERCLPGTPEDNRCAGRPSPVRRCTALRKDTTPRASTTDFAARRGDAGLGGGVAGQISPGRPFAVDHRRATRSARAVRPTSRLRHMLAILGAVSALAFMGAWALSELGVRRHTARIIKATNALSLGDFGSRVGRSLPGGRAGTCAWRRSTPTADARFEEQSGEIQRLNEEPRASRRRAYGRDTARSALRQLEARTQGSREPRRRCSRTPTSTSRSSSPTCRTSLRTPAERGHRRMRS